MGVNWKQKKWLKVVKDEIIAICSKNSDWISRNEVIKAILDNDSYSKEISRISNARKAKTVGNMIAWLDARVTELSDDRVTVPDSLVDIVAEAQGLVERTESKPYSYRLRDENSPLRRGYWIFVARDDNDSIPKRTANQLYELDMRNHFWGLGEGAHNIGKIKAGDKVVFYLGDSGNHSFYGTATLKSRFLNKKLAKKNGYDFSGVELTNIDLLEKPIAINSILHRLKFVKNKRDYRSYLRGSITSISSEDYTAVAGEGDDIEQQRIELDIQSVEPFPKLTESPKYTRTIRKKRYGAFKREVRKNYKFRCAVCGSSRFSRNEIPEVEASHIYPIKLNGSNDFRNGIALCKLHHWAFENGLFGIRDDYTITIEKRISNDEEYEDINRFAGKSIALPKNHLPHTIFLRAHRKLHKLS